MYILLYALMCRSIWVKSGEEWVKSCCELFTPAIALFIGIPEGLVKSISVFASALLHIISRNMCQFNDEKSFN